MAYQTGTATTNEALKTILLNFATSNGWTLTGGTNGWLSKGQSFVSIGGYTQVIASITRASTVATVTTIGFHGLSTANTITIRGATDSLYNGTFAITSVPTSSTFTYTMSGTPAANATLTNSYLSADTSGGADHLTLWGATGNGVNINPNIRLMNIPIAKWPLTYYLFYSSNPDQIMLVVNYDVNKIQYLVFGDIVKVHNSAYTGGNWFYGPYIYGGAPLGIGAMSEVEFRSGQGSGASVQIEPFIPFTGAGELISPSAGSHPIHIEIDGHVWPNAQSVGGYYHVNVTDETIRTMYRSPNTWNNQAHLVTMHLQFRATDFYMYLGYVEHLRFVRVTNYNIGDIITLGADKWKVFPWVFKNTVTPNGPGGVGETTSGTIGFAVRYDGP